MIIAKKFLNKVVKESLEIITNARRITNLTDAQWDSLTELAQEIDASDDCLYILEDDGATMQGIAVDTMIDAIKNQIDYRTDELDALPGNDIPNITMCQKEINELEGSMKLLEPFGGAWLEQETTPQEAVREQAGGGLNGKSKHR